MAQYTISVHDLLLKFSLETESSSVGSHSNSPTPRLHLYFPMQITLHHSFSERMLYQLQETRLLCRAQVFS